MRLRNLLAIVTLLVLPSRLPAAGAEPPIGDRYARAAEIKRNASKEWGLNSRVTTHWIEGGDRFWYVRELPGGTRFTVVEAATGAKADAFDHARLAALLSVKMGKPVEAGELPISGVRILPGRVEFTAAERRFAYSDAGGLVDRGEARTLYTLSPDRKQGIFSKDNNLWVENLENGTKRQITFDGEEHYEYGGAVAATTFPYTPPLVLWSPDSTKIFTAQTDDRRVQDLPVIDYAPKDGVRSKVIHYPFALAGDANVTTFRLVIIDIATGRQTAVRDRPLPAIRMNYDTPMQSNRMWWRADSKLAYFVDIERGERDVRVLSVDPDSGDTRELFREQSDRPVGLGPDIYNGLYMRPLARTNQLIWYSDRSGYGNLYLYDLNTGKLIRRITKGVSVVRDILAIDEKRREIVFTRSGGVPGRNPYYREVVRAGIDTGAQKVLSASDGDHVVTRYAGVADYELYFELVAGADQQALSGVSPSGNFFVETVTRADRPSETVVRDRDGGLVATVERADHSRTPTWFRWPTPIDALAADGTTPIAGLVFRPSFYDPSKKYPVIDYIYAGPQASFVPKAFGSGAYFDAAAFAELGFVVVIVDGRGTAFRDRAFQMASYGKHETASNLEDHITFVQQLAKADPSIDLDRVGINGFSGGGYGAALGMVRYPDWYKVGVAGDGNYDQRLFVHGWAERYEGYPVGDNYAAQAVKTYAPQLKGKLLLVHGMLDRAVTPAALFQLVQALTDANRNFDMLLQPRLSHELNDYAWRRIWDYFTTNLAGEAPPPNFLLRTDETASEPVTGDKSKDEAGSPLDAAQPAAVKSAPDRKRPER